ncbi:hypothetical protein [Deinococcus aquaticus]|uniref:hypothetical protein n=1 Tax=Deinococcus aquaticus TaxID=328692 RepID=UPI00361BDA3B
MPLSDYSRPSPARIRLFLSLLLLLVLTAVVGRRRPGNWARARACAAVRSRA